MKLNIPRLGDTVELVSPWTFELKRDDLNTSVWKLIGLPWDDDLPYYYQPDFSDAECQQYKLRVADISGPHIYGRHRNYFASVTLPVGVQLVIDRIYIRKGASDFDSVTFTIVKNTYPGYKKGKARFWASLDHVNEMEVCRL